MCDHMAGAFEYFLAVSSKTWKMFARFLPTEFGKRNCKGQRDLNVNTYSL